MGCVTHYWSPAPKTVWSRALNGSMGGQIDRRDMWMGGRECGPMAMEGFLEDLGGSQAPVCSPVPLLSPGVKATVGITKVQALLGSFCSCSLYVYVRMCAHARGGQKPSLASFLRCCPSSFETGSLAGLDLTPSC